MVPSMNDEQNNLQLSLPNAAVASNMVTEMSETIRSDSTLLHTEESWGPWRSGELHQYYHE